MSTETIIIDNYKFELELLSKHINIKLTDITHHYIYQSNINEDDRYIKPIQKFYSMIIKSLNKEPNYNFIINNNKKFIICIISYSNEVINIDEYIVFTKLEDSKELLLLDKIKVLEKKITELEAQQNNLIFAYRFLSEETISFNINSVELDFTKYYNDEIYKMGLYYIKCIETINYNQFKKVKKIITNQITYLMVDMKFRIHHNSALYLPSVTEIMIYINDTSYLYKNNIKPTLESECYINPHTFPNLEEIYYINNYLNNDSDKITTIHPINYHKSGFFKKLKLVSYKYFAKYDMINTNNLIETILYAETNNIKLEIT